MSRPRGPSLQRGETEIVLAGKFHPLISILADPCAAFCRLRNDAPADNHWLKIKLIGTKSNRSAIGARVLVRYGKKIQAQQLLSQSSYLSSNDPRLHFGLGRETTADIEIRWPNGLQESASNLAADQLVIFREGSGIVTKEKFSLHRTPATQ